MVVGGRDMRSLMMASWRGLGGEFDDEAYVRLKTRDLTLAERRSFMVLV